MATYTDTAALIDRLLMDIKQEGYSVSSVNHVETSKYGTVSIQFEYTKD